MPQMILIKRTPAEFENEKLFRSEMVGLLLPLAEDSPFVEKERYQVRLGDIIPALKEKGESKSLEYWEGLPVEGFVLFPIEDCELV